MLVKETLNKYPLFDIPILRHGFTDYMRDYDILVQADWKNDKGTFLYRFKHCVEANLMNQLSIETMKLSWDESFIDFNEWEKLNSPPGFVWGVKYSSAYPGLKFDTDANDVTEWSQRLNKEMHAVIIETNVYKLRLVFHDVEVIKLDKNSDLKDSLHISIKSV